MVNSYRYVFAATTPTIPTSGSTGDLGIGQVGVFDGKTWQATSGVSAKSIIIAQGVPATKWMQGVAKGNFTPKTEVIKGNAIRSWKKASAQRGQGMVVTMGYDGVDETKNLTVKQGDNFTFWLTLSGSPVANFLAKTPETHYATWTEQFTVVLPCVDDCADNCGATVDPNIVADAAIDVLNRRKIPGGQLLTDYVKFTKLVSCETPSGLPTTSYTIWTLEVPDAGDQAALGKVQAAYPGEAITRTKRNGIFSTYEVVLPAGETPDAFSNEENPVVPTCDTCPSGCPDGYSLTTAQDVWIISRPLSGATDLNDPTARTAYATSLGNEYSATTEQFLSYNLSSASVQMYFPTGTDVTALLSDSAVQVGTNTAICTQDSPDEIDWVECRTCLAAEKNFVLTIKNTDCGGTYLTQLQEIYGDGVSILSTNSATCTTQYQLTVESDNKDCDACDSVDWKFTAPAPFEGLVWTEVQGEHYGTDCFIGIKAESIYEQRKTKECFLKQVAYEFEPLFLSFSTRNPDPNNFEVLCENDVPVTVVQNVSYPRGLGRVVADQVIASNYSYNQQWRKNPAERDAFEYELGLDLEGYYDQYILEFDTYPIEATAVSGFGVSQVQTFEHSFFFPEGTGGDFEAVISAFVASNATNISLEEIGS